MSTPADSSAEERQSDSELLMFADPTRGHIKPYDIVEDSSFLGTMIEGLLVNAFWPSEEAHRYNSVHGWDNVDPIESIP